MRALFYIAKAALLLAGIWTIMWSLTLWNRFTILRHRADYHPTTFIVADAHHQTSGGSTRSGPSTSYWLTGTIDGTQEKFIPPGLTGDRYPHSGKDLSRFFPRGTRVNVWYNPAMTQSIMQGETLRVIEDQPDLWEHEVRLRNRIMVLIAVPLACAGMFFVLVRRAMNARNSAQAPPQNL
jgi:hypothetical protein